MDIKELISKAVVIPTMQGIVVGAFFASGITSSSLMYESTSGSQVLPWKFTLFSTFTLISGAAILHKQRKWESGFFPNQEPKQIMKREYAAQSRMTVVETPFSSNYASGSIIDVPEGIHQHQIRRAAMLIVHSGWKFSHALLSGQNRPFTRSQYELFRDMICMPKGWIEWKNTYAHNQGVCVLRAGKNAFKYISSPTPDRSMIH